MMTQNLADLLDISLFLEVDHAWGFVAFHRCHPQNRPSETLKRRFSRRILHPCSHRVYQRIP